MPRHSGRIAAGASVIHVASHAETETNHPLESFLLFSGDGAVTARDLLGMRLQADMVVLSACETARGKIGQGDGVMGLGWAMLAAGAHSAVLSQWKVDSAATGDLMIDFHRRLASRQGRIRPKRCDRRRWPSCMSRAGCIRFTGPRSSSRRRPLSEKFFHVFQYPPRSTITGL